MHTHEILGPPRTDVATEPKSIAWASAFAADAPRIDVPIPGPASLALMERRNRYEFGTFTWLDRMPIAFASGAGVTVEDADGNKLIDLTHGHMGAGLGHGNPEVAAAITEHAHSLMNLRNYPIEVRVRLMERLAEITPGNLNLFGFFSSGTEATEAAMRVARAVTGGHEFLSFYGDYHGKTTGAISTADSGTPSTGPRLGGVVTVPGGWCHRCEFGLEPQSCGLHCVGFADRALRANSHGAIAGIIAEPITNGSGARVYAPGFLSGLREIADRHKAVLIFDEHATGLGRTGAWWAGDHEGVTPDIIIFGKTLGNGYPITAIAIREEYHAATARVSVSSTHGGMPAGCGAALAVLDIIERDGLIEHIRASGDACLAALKEMQTRHPIIGIAQGKGYLLGLELVDVTTGQPSHALAADVAAACMARGVCISLSGAAVRVSPMLVTSQEVALRALTIVDEAVVEVESQQR